MPNEGFFELKLTGVEKQPIYDPDVDITFRTVSQVIAQYPNQRFPSKAKFKLPAFPQTSNLFADIAPSRYRLVKSGFFTLTNGQTLSQTLQILREPKQWQPEYSTWAKLPASFQALQKVLRRSPNIQVKEKKSSVFPFFTEAVYDSVTDEKVRLAKTALLNLYARTTRMIEPVNQQQNWFSFVARILQIGRERFIAQADPQLGEIVRTIKANITQFADYKHANAQNHFENVAAAAPPGYKVIKSRMFSIKSTETTGNLQLTLAPAKDDEGDEILLLDLDIDENGELLKHLCDAFRHIFTGGTHPHDIHEYLRLTYDKIDLGYRLV